MRFKEFINTTPKRNIIHFENMKPLECLQLLKHLKENNNTLKNIKTTLKVDGFSARFGKDQNGKFFFETGRSGIIQDKNKFIEFNKSKSQEHQIRAQHYTNLYELLEKSDYLYKDFPNNTKIICEFLYTPMASSDNELLKFVHVGYDKAKLGKTLTIIPLEIIGNYSKKQLLKKSNNTIKIISPELQDLTITLDFEFPDIQEIDLKSKDKYNCIELLNQIKNSISEQILDKIGNPNLLGPENEGIVLEINNKFYKITTKKFKKSIYKSKNT